VEDVPPSAWDAPDTAALVACCAPAPSRAGVRRVASPDALAGAAPRAVDAVPPDALAGAVPPVASASGGRWGGLAAGVVLPCGVLAAADGLGGWGGLAAGPEVR
jgi:hypothetical protein